MLTSHISHRSLQSRKVLQSRFTPRRLVVDWVKCRFNVAVFKKAFLTLSMPLTSSLVVLRGRELFEIASTSTSQQHDELIDGLHPSTSCVSSRSPHILKQRRDYLRDLWQPWSGQQHKPEWTARMSWFLSAVVPNGRAGLKSWLRRWIWFPSVKTPRPCRWWDTSPAWAVLLLPLTSRVLQAVGVWADGEALNRERVTRLTSPAWRGRTTLRAMISRTRRNRSSNRGYPLEPSSWHLPKSITRMGTAGAFSSMTCSQAYDGIDKARTLGAMCDVRWSTFYNSITTSITWRTKSDLGVTWDDHQASSFYSIVFQWNSARYKHISIYFMVNTFTLYSISRSNSIGTHSF